MLVMVYTAGAIIRHTTAGKWRNYRRMLPFWCCSRDPVASIKLP
jgi:hypothetical protein